MKRALVAGFLALAGTAAGSAEADAVECTWEPSVVDPAATPVAPAAVAALPFPGRFRPVSWREFVAPLGPAGEEVAVSSVWRRLRWTVADGTSLVVVVHGPCDPLVYSAEVSGVGPGHAEPGSPEAVVRAFYRWIIVDALVEEPDWSATVSGLVTPGLLRAMSAERKAYRACTAWQYAQLPIRERWQDWRYDLERDPRQPTYEDMVLQPRGRFLSHLYPTGATGFTTTMHGADARTASVAVTLYGGEYRWTDEVLLRREQAQWRIVDVNMHDPTTPHRAATQDLVDHAQAMAETCLCPPRGGCVWTG